MGQNMGTAILLQDNVPARLDWLAKIVLIVQLVLLVIIVIVALQAMIIMGILIAENLDTKVKGDAWKRAQAQNFAINQKFSSNMADIQAKLPTHEVVILTMFHKDGKKIVDFLLTQNFWFVPFFMHHPLGMM